MTWPVGGIPVRPFDGFVKRVRVDENEGLAGHILDLAFPLFRGTDSVSTQEGRVRADFYGNDRNIQLPGRQPRRRFSGGLPGESLPRGRYYSLCREFPPGSKEAKTQSADSGVLSAELSAYADWSVSGPVLVFDWSSRDAVPEFQRPLAGGPATASALGVLFLRESGARSIMDIMLDEKERDPSFKDEDWGGVHQIIQMTGSIPIGPGLEYRYQMAYRVNIQYKIEEIHLSRVVDLRYPDTQEAFLKVFIPELSSAGLDGFLTMLPTLLASQLGGSDATNLIGSYLRTHGADGLVYPSARFDPWVRFQNDTLADFGGWNLVDYRGAPSAHLPAFSRDLFRPEPADRLKVEKPPPGREYGYGSWKVPGVMHRAHGRQMDQLRRYVETRDISSW